MTSITQTIPGFTAGISQQPDELMLPGQVKDLVNGLPDITDGLVKRNGSRYLATLSGMTTDGAWFSYYRDQDEGAYIGQVHRDGTVSVWQAETGASVTVTGAAVNYMTHTEDNQLKFLTASDTTFVTNTKKVVAMTSTVSASRPYAHEAFIELRRLEHGREYSFSVSTLTDTEQLVGPTGSGRCVALEVDTPTKGTPPAGFREIARGNAQTGIDPSLEHQGSEIFSVSSGSGLNLTFRLTTIGQVNVQSNPNTSIQGNDYVGIYSSNVELLSGGFGWTVGDTVTVNMKGVNYTVRVTDTQEVRMKHDLGYFRPAPTSYDAAMDISADTLLGQIKRYDPNASPPMSQDNALNLAIVEKIGNGVYLASNTPFQVHTRQPDLWKITNMETNSVTDLPRSCKHGFTVKVLNSGESALDDFYLKFVGDGNADGAGRWEETIGFGIETNLDPATLPKRIQRKEDSNGNIYFHVSDPPWVAREVGDDTTNPKPSIVGNTISQTFLHRNRLGFLSEDNVVLSQTGEIYNFFQNSALVVAANDPVDIQASSTQPTKFIDCIETNTGLVIFAETQQFMLHTDSDTLTPETGKLSNISTYRYSPESKPISLGTTIGFVDSAGVYGRFFEMFDIRREGEPQVIEQSKIVQNLLPHDTDIVINSRENNTIFFGKSGTGTIHGYRYYNSGSKRVQSAWFTWEFPFAISYAFVLDDKVVFITANAKLLELNLQQRDATREITSKDFYGEDKKYLVYLDSSELVTAGSYNSTTRETSVTWSAVAGVNQPTVAAVNRTDGSVYIAKSTSGSTHYFTGDISGESLIIGFLYEMSVELPKLYVKTKAGDRTTADVNASLTIQRANMRFGTVGKIEVKLQRRGKDDFSVKYDSSLADWYQENEAPFISERTIQVPVYERNHNVNLTIKSNHPGPASFHSMTWEGDYTPMYHKRV